MMLRKHIPVAECREYVDDGRIVGAIINYWYKGQARYIVEIRDWCREGGLYVPVCIGPRDSLLTAEDLIESAARNAQEGK